MKEILVRDMDADFWNLFLPLKRRNMQTSFSKIMDFVLEIEGGLVNDKDDPGGLTKYGISKRSYPDVDIAGLTESKAREIYKRDYWDKLHLDDVSYPLDVCAFDTAVNMGVAVSADFLKRNGDYRDFLLDRVDRYIEISRKNTALQKFFRGWLIRVSRLRKLCRG